jgi:hypothetical protein
MRIAVVTTATLALAAWLAPSASAAMCIRLYVNPAIPTLGTRTEIGLRTYAPYPEGLRAWRVTNYPFHVQALAPTGRVFRVLIRSAPANKWIGLFRFPMTGTWTIRVTNFGPRYTKGCSEVLHLRVAKRR